jgi:hypothetical protein
MLLLQLTLKTKFFWFNFLGRRVDTMGFSGEMPAVLKHQHKNRFNEPISFLPYWLVLHGSGNDVGTVLSS